MDVMVHIFVFFVNVVFGFVASKQLALRKCVSILSCIATGAFMHLVIEVHLRINYFQLSLLSDDSGCLNFTCFFSVTDINISTGLR